MDKKDFPALTGIRFVAATLVYIFHYAHILLAGNEDTYAYSFLRQLNIGVSLFFVLSGFLIAYRYFEMDFSRKNFRFYMAKRVARIFPLYLVLLLIQFSLFFLLRQYVPDAKTVFMNVTLLKGLHKNFFFTGLAQSWSLTVEELFYLLAPFSFFLIRTKGLFWLQVLALAGVGLLLALFCTNPSSVVYFDNVYFMWLNTFFGRAFEFFVGIYLALRLLNRKEHASSKPLLTVSGGGLFLLLVSLLARWANDGNNETAPGRIVLLNAGIPVAIGLFYDGLMREESQLKRLLGSKALVLLGKSSYAFYLLHVGMVAEVIYYHYVPNLFLLYLLLQLLAIAAYKLFEKPVYFSILRRFAAFRK